MDQNVQGMETTMDDGMLMTCCIQGLLRYAKELETTQGVQARDKVTELHDLSREIVSFWDLDGALLDMSCEAG